MFTVIPFYSKSNQRNRVLKRTVGLKVVCVMPKAIFKLEGKKGFLKFASTIVD